MSAVKFSMIKSVKRGMEKAVEGMKLVGRHLTVGLVYACSLRILPSLVGTIIPFFWQLVNLYGTLPALLIILGIFHILIVSLAAIVYPFLLLLELSFLTAYCLAALVMVLAFLSWVVINISINYRAGFKLIKLQFSTRTALLLLGLLLGHRFLPLPVSPKTTFWDIHIKPHLAGQLHTKSREEIIAAIRHDYQKVQNILPDAIFFGCSPGSFKNLLVAAGVQESQFSILETIIPPEHARVFGLNRPFYFYVISVNHDHHTV
jgi:hypothetical protein